MKVLVVLTQPPLPEGGAAGRCAVALLRGLRSHGVDVEALAARQTFAVPGEPPPDLPVEVLDVQPHRLGWRGRFERLRRPRGDLAEREFGERVREAAGRADVVHLEETETAWCDEGVRTPSLAHVHYLVRRDRSLTWPWRQAFRDYVELALAERAAVRRHRWLVASSPIVADALRAAAPSAEVVLAPLALDPTYYRRAELTGPPTAGLIGTGSWPPTAAAIDRLVTAVWPKVRSVNAAARLVVAGRRTRKLVREEVDGVDVLGDVPSSTEFFGRLSLLLFPLLRGSGMKVKVLEAMACGVPVVTTPPGAEGIAANAGVVVANSDRELAAAAVELLADVNARRERGAIARSTFEELYTPHAATAPLVGLYARMLTGQPPT